MKWRSEFQSLSDDELRARLKLTPAPPCPKCGGARVIPIFWGHPGDPAIFEAGERRLLEIGGCCIYGDGTDPKWSCRDCGERFGSFEP